MALKIRLARAGTKKRPFYHIVVAESGAPRDGRFIERVGYFNPLLPKDHEDALNMKEDRIKDWLSKGAQPTDRVLRFLDKAGIMERKARSNPLQARKKDRDNDDKSETRPFTWKPNKQAARVPARQQKTEVMAAEWQKKNAPVEDKAPAEETASEEEVIAAEETASEEAPAEETKAEE